jgi:hypothetical protein
MDQIHHGHLNRIFEVAGVKYLPRPEPAARGSKKRMVATTFVAEVIQGKTMGAKWRRHFISRWR